MSSANIKSLQLNLKLKEDDHDIYDREEQGLPSEPQVPSLWGLPLKYISLVTLAAQNSLLTIIMHYSRVSTPSSRAYSAATAVLMNELLKGTISLVIAFSRIEPPTYEPISPGATGSSRRLGSLIYRGKRLVREICSTDCWKLSIPAILYVIQNNLQYVAASNLEAATFQVSYQMKILTTAAFSVMLLRKRLSPSQWLALLCLAIGVGIVQIQSSPGNSAQSHSGANNMHPLTGFTAVVAACFTSGLAGVYFEMVLKNSQADLWVRNVQLSIFSILPALVPVIFAQQPSEPDTTVFRMLFHNFGIWAWATVLVQVLGGLVTAMVIKYSDNILKGFATSLSIVISFLASVALFDFQMTFTFILGSVVVLIATWLYNQPAKSTPGGNAPREGRQWGINLAEKSRSPNSSQRVSPNAPYAAPGYVSHSPSTTSLLSLTSEGSISPEGEPIVGLRIPSEVDAGRMSRMASTSSLPSLNNLRNISN